jgi:hypothetical protein
MLHVLQKKNPLKDIHPFESITLQRQINTVNQSPQKKIKLQAKVHTQAILQMDCNENPIKFQKIE